MKVLIVGGGGREHAVAWHIAQSHLCTGLYCAPGNAGISQYAECVDIQENDLRSLVKFAQDEVIDLVIIGPEGPLAAGLVDMLFDAGIKAFGPSASAARLEGSKRFMKDLCANYGVPTASYGCFESLEDALSYADKQPLPIVIKASGLAAGKGVVICNTSEERDKAIMDMLEESIYGAAGSEIVIEEFLDGEELSYFAISDGKTVLPLTSAQDYKRALDGDKGPNTGGMGAYSPAHMVDEALQKQIDKEIIKPIIAGMEKEGCAFSGILYAGIMLVEGNPVVLEFNVRFGDPECQAIMMRLETDLLELLSAATEGQLATMKEDIFWRQKAALCVVMAAKGYPGPYSIGSVIDGVQEADQLENIKVFHAGTGLNDNNELINTGGRVLGITALGDTISSAQSRAYDAIGYIKWDDGVYRKDIGWRAIDVT